MAQISQEKLNGIEKSSMRKEKIASDFKSCHPNRRHLTTIFLSIQIVDQQYL